MLKLKLMFDLYEYIDFELDNDLKELKWMFITVLD